jgi:molybdopterin-guanine dinucleotide biosynthesis protein A
LAGGQARRLGGRDKAFIQLGGRSLLDRCIEGLRPQVDGIAISSNADPARFHDYGTPVLADVRPGFLGPLAGILTGLLAWPTACVVSVAVDLPFLPPDLVAHLRAGIGEAGCAYASDGTHHALAILWRPGMAATLAGQLDKGEASLKAILTRYGRPVVFRPTADTDVAFNINTPDDLARAERRVAGH